MVVVMLRKCHIFVALGVEIVVVWANEAPSRYHLQRQCECGANVAKFCVCVRARVRVFLCVRARWLTWNMVTLKPLVTLPLMCLVFLFHHSSYSRYLPK
jgi:hypothetical protein